MQFGRKSQQLDRQIERLETELEELTGGRGVADVRRARASGTSAPVGATSSKEALPPHLPRDEQVLEPDASCPNCDNAMQPLGEDVSEQLAHVCNVQGDSHDPAQSSLHPLQSLLAAADAGPAD
jgi:transposase